MRRNKKREYISGLVFDRDHFQNEITLKMENKDHVIWFHGDRYNLFRAKFVLKQLNEEIEKISKDETYKPWKDEN